MPLPPADASPRQVVLEYLHALGAHDGRVAEALSAPGFRAPQRCGCTTPPASRIRIAGTYFSRGVKGPPVSVYVSYWHSSYQGRQDPSFPDGKHAWGCDLTRIRGRWLIVDEGVG